MKWNVYFFVDDNPKWFISTINHGNQFVYCFYNIDSTFQTNFDCFFKETKTFSLTDELLNSPTQHQHPIKSLVICRLTRKIKTSAMREKKIIHYICEKSGHLSTFYGKYSSLDHLKCINREEYEQLRFEGSKTVGFNLFCSGILAKLLPKNQHFPIERNLTTTEQSYLFSK